MGKQVIFFSVIIIVFHNSTSSDVSTPTASLQEHVKKIDEMLADMQSHAQAQEQKNSAVLSSVLSQLTQTTEKLSDLEISHNDTILMLKEKDAELSELWTNYNETVIELEETRSKLDDLEKRNVFNGNIGFQGRVLNSKNVTANTPIHFDWILYDKGASYKKNTGKFLVPMNGTYLVWTDLTYQSHGRPGGFLIKTDTSLIEQAYGRNSLPQESISTVNMCYLHQGESVWVEPTKDVHLYNSFCYFGTVLLNAH